MYIATGRGRQSTGDKILMTTERSFLFAHMLQVSKWSLWILILYTFFNHFIHVYSPGAKADKPLESKFWCQQKDLTTWTICCKVFLPICCKFQNDLFEFWFYIHFSIILYMYVAPGQGQKTLCGQNYDVNRKALSLQPFVASLKKISFNSDFIHIFYVFPHVYSPGAGVGNPLGTKFWCQQKVLVTLPI